MANHIDRKLSNGVTVIRGVERFGDEQHKFLQFFKGLLWLNSEDFDGTDPYCMIEYKKEMGEFKGS